MQKFIFVGLQTAQELPHPKFYEKYTVGSFKYVIKNPPFASIASLALGATNTKI